MYLLVGPGESPQIGPERGRRRRSGIALYSGPRTAWGQSHRFVLYASGKALGALQAVQGAGQAVAANVYVAPGWRRTGIATKLFEHAARLLGPIRYSEHRSPAGQALVSALGRRAR